MIIFLLMYSFEVFSDGLTLINYNTWAGGEGCGF